MDLMRMEGNNSFEVEVVATFDKPIFTTVKN